MRGFRVWGGGGGGGGGGGCYLRCQIHLFALKSGFRPIYGAHKDSPIFKSFTSP